MLDLPWHAAEWPASGCLGLALACLLGRRALTSLDAKTGRAHASPVPVRAQNAAPIADRPGNNARGPDLDAFKTQRSCRTCDSTKITNRIDIIALYSTSKQLAYSVAEIHTS